MNRPSEIATATLNASSTREVPRLSVYRPLVTNVIAKIRFSSSRKTRAVDGRLILNCACRSALLRRPQALTASASQPISPRVSSSRGTQGRGRMVLADSACGRRAEEIAAKSPYLLERDPELDKRVEWRRRGGGVVLAMEHAHGCVEGADRWEWALPTGCALEVMHRHARHIHDLPAILLDPVGPVQIFAIHKIGLVQQPNLAQHRAAHQHARPDHCVDLGLHIWVEMAHIVAAIARAVREQAREAGHAVERDLGRGEGSPACHIE